MICNLFIRPILQISNSSNKHNYKSPFGFNKNFYSTVNITKEVSENACVLFMKGQPDAPQCGFSRAVVQVLEIQRAKYKSFNVLNDEDLRAGIKKFTNWPTIPQLFIGGKFVGGCDIALDLHKSGELEKLLKEAKAKE